MNTPDFVSVAMQGFGLGLVIGFLFWSFSYCCSMIRRSILSATKIADLG